MNLNPRAWMKRGVIAGIGGAAIAFTLLSGTVSADDNDGKYCVAKNPKGECVVYGQKATTWAGSGQNRFVTSNSAAITIEPGYYDYIYNTKYLPSYCYNIAGYTVAYANATCYGYAGYYYGGVIVSPANLPPATYAVVAAAADSLNANRSYIYSLLAAGESLDRVTDRFGVYDATFLNNFYVQLDARINELRAVNAIQQWQADALRNNVRQPGFITQTNLLTWLAQY